MTRWLNGIIAFAIVALVAGGLGWATRAALHLERDRLEQQAAAEHADRLRIALWRLDSRMSAALAREDIRPFSHYSALFAPPLALDAAGRVVQPGSVLHLSPLLSTELPPWMRLHFQADDTSWGSPQVLTHTLQARIRHLSRNLGNVTAERRDLLAELSRDAAVDMLARTRRHAGQTTFLDHAMLANLRDNEEMGQQLKPSMQGQLEYAFRRGQSSKITNTLNIEERVAKNVAVLNFCRNGEDWLDDPTEKKDFEMPPMRQPYSAEVAVRMSSMVGMWLPVGGRERLVVARLVRVEEKDICQGIVLDGDSLMSLLAEEVRDLFPKAEVLPVGEPTPELLDRTMTTLPMRLEPGPPEPVAPAGWTAMRVGLGLAWAAVVVAAVAVGMGGWSLVRLSQRRVRFVSAVTHELRTPLTALRLYLDLLMDGPVSGEKTRREYLETMHAETDRLTRLVGNVLDFSRLEGQSPKLSRQTVSATEMTTKVSQTWRSRCERAGKELIVEGCEGEVNTDIDLLAQVLGNLLDNACKYSHEAEDKRLWLRARREGTRIVFEVQDRGPGVPVGERGSIFRPFRRGKAADATTGGVGLGLALATRWTELLGGRLTLCCPGEGGACFRVELPALS